MSDLNRLETMQELLSVSEELKVHLENLALFKTDRDAFIEGVQNLLKTRQVKIDAYQWVRMKESSEPIVFTPEEKVIGKQLVEVDAGITRLLSERMKGHQEERRSLHNKGKSAAKYVNPFQMPTRDGVFLDKRK